MDHNDKQALRAEWLLLMGLQESSIIVDTTTNTNLFAVDREVRFRAYKLGRRVYKLDR